MSLKDLKAIHLGLSLLLNYSDVSVIQTVLPLRKVGQKEQWSLLNTCMALKLYEELCGPASSTRKWLYLTRLL